MEADKLLIKNDAGELIEYSILSLFKIDNKEDNYALFTDYSINEDKTLNIYSGILLPSGEVKSVEDSNDLAVINEYLENLGLL